MSDRDRGEGSGEADRLIAALKEMAGRVGAEFVVDPTKLQNYRRAIEAKSFERKAKTAR